VGAAGMWFAAIVNLLEKDGSMLGNVYSVDKVNYQFDKFPPPSIFIQ